jgi:hypothetical protein
LAVQAKRESKRAPSPMMAFTAEPAIFPGLLSVRRSATARADAFAGITLRTPKKSVAGPAANLVRAFAHALFVFG